MKLGIYGAGGLGREVYELSLRINSRLNKWSEILFIDDSNNPKKLRDINIINFQDLISVKNIEVCIAIGEPYVRKEIFLKLLITK